MSTVTAEKSDPIVNGLNTEQMMELAGKIAAEDDFSKFKFRARNHWLGGSRSRTSIQGFYAGGEEKCDRKDAISVDADQPFFLGGKNTAPNAVEYLLHSLTSCLNTTLVAHASVQGIVLEEVEISAEGDMNVKGFFGISDEVNRGYERIRVDMKVKSEADVGTIRSLAMYSPVYEVVSRSVPTELTVKKI